MANGADGKVVYKVETDDSDLSSQLKRTENKIKKSSNDTAKKQKQDQKDVSDSANKETGKIGKFFQAAFDSIKGKSGNLKDSLGATFEEIASSVGLSTDFLVKGGIVGAIGAIGMAATSTAMDVEASMNTFVAKTGVAKGSLDEFEGVMKEIYANNYGESFEDIANAMATVKQQNFTTTNEELQEITQNALALRDTFDFDINESVRTVNMLMRQFGISSEEAFNLIVQGAQKGLDKNGDLLDTINEYSVHFEQLGLSAEEMFNMLANGAADGTFSVDKLGDAVKEFGIRMKDGSASDTLKQMGLDADDLSRKFAAGGDQAKEAFTETVNALKEMEDPLAQSQAGVALFGTMFEDLGLSGISALTEIQGEFDRTEESMNQLNEVKYDSLADMFEGLTRAVELLLLPLGEALVPLLSQIIEAIMPILMELIPPLTAILQAVVGPILEIIESLQPLIDLITSILIPLIDFLSSVISTQVSAIAKNIGDMISNIMNGLNGIIDFIVGVFTGNWARAWEGVKAVFSSIVNGIANIFKAPINWIIDGINAFIRGLNRIKIPKWVPVVGGKGFNISQIPRLKVGMDFVPSDFYPAYLDYGEAVLTKEENAKLRSLGGIDALENQISTQTFNQSLDIDYDRLAKAMEGLSINMDGEKVGYIVTDGVDKNMGLTNSRKGRFGV